MAKISLKKKVGGTRVGNALRAVGKVVKSQVGVGGLTANALSSRKPKVTQTSSGTQVGKTFYAKSGSVSSAFPSNPAKGTVTKGGLTFNASDSGNIPSNFKTSPVNLGKAVQSGGISIDRPASSSNISTKNTSSGSSINTLSSEQIVNDVNTTNFSSGSNTSFRSSTPNLPSTTVVNASSFMNQNPALVIPEEPVTDYSQYIPAPIDTEAQQAEKDTKDSLDKYLKSLMDTPSSADAYEQAQRETGILEKQNLVNTLTGKLNEIVNRGQANQLSLVGQGRGIPEAIIGGQQAQIGRETAIAALPVQAQLSAAQGDLQSAEENLNTLFKIYSDDAQRKYDRKVTVMKALYDVADTKQKRVLDKQKLIEERAYQEERDNRNAIRTLTIEAAKNGTPASVIKSMSTARNYGDALTLGVKYATDPLDRQLKQAQLDKLKAGDTSTSGASPATSSVLDVTKALFNNPGLGAITGTLQQFTGGILGRDAKLARNQWKQLKGILSLENRQMLKGSGAISDFEFRVLGEAATSLGRNLNDEDFKQGLLDLITKLSPEYQYVNNISNIIQTTQEGTTINSYVQELYK